MNGQLFGTLPTGTRFYYHGDHKNIYMKVDTNVAIGDTKNIQPGESVLVFTFDYCEQDNHGTQVGYLHDGHFVCFNCIDRHLTEERPNPDASVYLVNVTPYKQSCHDCERLVVLGRTPAWCELWD